MYERSVSARRFSASTWALPLLASIALVVHAQIFDFVCDDAFIALRQAQNLALHGAPVYNLGERVEAATSPLWAALLALGLLLRIPPVPLLQGASLAGGVLLVFATWHLVRRVLPERLFAQAFALAALVSAAPVAAWSIGGLETALAAAAITSALAQVDVVDRSPSPRAATLLGATLGLGALVRLEVLLLTVLVLLFLRRIDGRLLRRVAWLAFAPIALFTVFRVAYYGLPLPHTFYAKTAGSAGSRVKHGFGYGYFCIGELGFFLSLLLVASPFLVARSAALWTARAFVPLYVAYVIEIGGDFLDLYRFFVPLFPMLFVTFTAAAARAFDRYSASNAVRLVVGVLAFVPHASRQLSLGARALAVQDPSRAKLGIEPIGWTKRAAVEWSLVGAWLKGAALPGDTLATGAAGAMPFFSGLPNFDLLGLAAPEVARAGKRLGIRPGHARYATWEQIRAHNPAFLYIEWRPNERVGWEERGYVWIRVRTDGFLTTLLVRADRAERVLQRPDVEPLPK